MSAVIEAVEKASPGQDGVFGSGSSTCQSILMHLRYVSDDFFKYSSYSTKLSVYFISFHLIICFRHVYIYSPYHKNIKNILDNNNIEKISHI